jgi:endonuclease/exonuclease/phosphatase (EEP) superfamily protein YafD
VNSTDRSIELPPSVEQGKPKQKLNRDWRGAYAALLVGLVGMAGSRLGYLWIGFDVVSQFAMQFIMLTVAALLGLAFPRYKGLFTSIFFVLFLAAYGLWPHITSASPAKVEAQIAGESQLKVASFNTLYVNQNYSGIATSILELNADVVTIIEFGADKAPVLAALKATYPYQFECIGNEDCEMAVISKLPMEKILGRGMWEGAPLLHALVHTQSGPVSVIGVHTTRFPHFRSQFKQVAGLAKYVETVQGPVVLMGDFNSTPFSRVNQTISQSLGFTRLTTLPSWPATYNFPQLAIDHIFVSSGIRPASEEQIGDNAGSDHFPVMITLAIPNQ